MLSPMKYMHLRDRPPLSRNQSLSEYNEQLFLAKFASTLDKIEAQNEKDMLNLTNPNVKADKEAKCHSARKHYYRQELINKKITQQE